MTIALNVLLGIAVLSLAVILWAVQKAQGRALRAAFAMANKIPFQKLKIPVEKLEPRDPSVLQAILLFVQSVPGLRQLRWARSLVRSMDFSQILRAYAQAKSSKVINERIIASWASEWLVVFIFRRLQVAVLGGGALVLLVLVAVRVVVR